MRWTGATMIGRARTIVSSSSVHRDSGEFNSRSFSRKLNVYWMQLRLPPPLCDIFNGQYKVCVGLDPWHTPGVTTCHTRPSQSVGVTQCDTWTFRITLELLYSIVS